MTRGRYRYRSLREELWMALRSPWRAIKEGAALGEVEDFWALREIDFDILPGETVGLIGRNGAGKSTLLKILSRVTPPTTGRVTLTGRVGSLLEVGTGFHPELSGRDNIYLNGAILGMSRREIRQKFDEIVAFSEVERFLDTPVKRYSSGMHVRLAFGVAAHLEPEILLVDEVLAVGDATFQRKCLSKMEDVGHSGRTVLFVSHNMPSITRLCERTILLDGGSVVADGPSHEVVKDYLQGGLGTTAERVWADPLARPGNEVTRLVAMRVTDSQGVTADAIRINESVQLRFEFEVLEAGHVLVPNFALYNADGVCVFSARDTDPAWRGRPRDRGNYTTTAVIPGNLLAEGTHVVTVAISTMNPVRVHLTERDAVAFEVIEPLDQEFTARGEYAGFIPGAVRPLLDWTNEFSGRTLRPLAKR